MKSTAYPPNIILLQGEDIGRHIGCYGDTVARTPHLDQLAAEGTRYTNTSPTRRCVHQVGEVW